MTFSLLARDGSGGFGMVVSSSSPCVAARCVHLRPGVGGAASQNITDPRLGSLLLDELGRGSATKALAAVVAAEPTAEYRQLTVLGASGAPAAHSGARTLGTHATAVAADAVAAGNLLATAAVPDAMITAFAAATGELETRLLAALHAGLAAGGEAGPVRSAGLVAVRDVAWPVTDLRVDWADDPIGDLGALLDVWLPQRDDYVTRGLDPATAPAYGVPGDG